MDIGCIGVPFEVKFAENDTAPLGSFEGYGAVFGNIDSHGDVIEPGAFAKSLLDRERAGRGLPPMYKMHGARTGNVHEPIGVWDAMSEDASGLHVKGRLLGLDTEQGKWNYAQVKERALTGLSIGYRVPAGGSKKGSGRAGEPARFLKMLHLSEVSLVDDPSNAAAQIYAMKSRYGLVAEFDPREMEGALRDAGLSRAEAVKAVAIFRKTTQRDAGDDADDALRDEAEAADLVVALKSAADRIRALSA